MDNSKEFQVMLDEAIRVEPDAFRDFDRTKNVQDQLQEMVDGGFTHQNFERFYQWYKSGIVQTLSSMEQLWLAFVMKSLYSKIWNGKEWS